MQVYGRTGRKLKRDETIQNTGARAHNRIPVGVFIHGYDPSKKMPSVKRRDDIVEEAEKTRAWNGVTQQGTWTRAESPERWREDPRIPHPRHM